jgi:menaquinol-cytochrome c reductase iron-sulfur subunit
MSEETFVSAESVGGDLDRRKFLSGIIGVVAAAVSVAVGIPAIGYLVSPGLKKQNEDTWITLGPLSSLTPGEPKGFPYSTRTKDGWVESSQSGVAYALTTDGQTVKVLSNVCTHLSCRVGWKTDQRVYFCPCHDGKFDVEGKVVSGPPPRPLDEFQSRIENGQIEILLEA